MDTYFPGPILKVIDINLILTLVTRDMQGEIFRLKFALRKIDCHQT